MMRRKIRAYFSWIMVALGPLMLSGCLADAASGVTSALFDKLFEEGPTEIEAKMTAVDDVNPDDDGNASPLVVWLYQLSSKTAFMRAIAQNRFTAVGRLEANVLHRWWNRSSKSIGSVPRYSRAPRARPMAAATPMAGAPRIAMVRIALTTSSGFLQVR